MSAGLLYCHVMEVPLTESMEVRRHVLENHVKPARMNRVPSIDLKVGDVQKELGWPPRCRQIIAALWTNKFESMARVRSLDNPGPKPQESCTVVLRFEVLR